MRAVEYSRYGGIEVLEIVEKPRPSCGPGEVRVEVHAVSVNPVDGKIRSGLLAPLPNGFPAVTGRDGAGLVVEAGEGVPSGMLGQRVCFLAPRGTGTWTEEIALPAELMASIPDSLSFADAASLGLAGTSAWIGLVDTAEISSGQRVLIHAAAGGVGSVAVQLARSLGATVIGTCSASNVDYVRSLGAAEAIAYDEVAFEDEVRDVDVVFDLIGGDVNRRSYRVLKRGGVMACLNAIPFEDRHAEFGVEVRKALVLPDRTALSGILAKADQGEIRSTIEVLPFEAFAEAQRLSDSGHVRGKIVLAVR